MRKVRLLQQCYTILIVLKIRLVSSFLHLNQSIPWRKTFCSTFGGDHDRRNRVDSSVSSQVNNNEMHCHLKKMATTVLLYRKNTKQRNTNTVHAHTFSFAGIHKCASSTVQYIANLIQSAITLDIVYCSWLGFVLKWAMQCTQCHNVLSCPVLSCPCANIIGYNSTV